MVALEARRQTRFEADPGRRFRGDVSDWPILNALLNSACGATWVSFHHGGGVGMGYSQHSGIALIADGSPEASEKIGRVLWNDPATGVMRHADTGYETAIDCARRNGLDLPGIL